ncbi:MAG: hypothetical protein MUC95_08620 [Spirochaetes bacterium]|nr:hypothetical protein [Spirochaetota bacterium]
MPITKAEKAAYNDYIKEYQAEIEGLKKTDKEISVKKRKMPAIASYYNIETVFIHLKMTTLYIKMSDASLEMLNIKNESFLNNARKEIYKIIQMLEETVGNDIDRTLKENEEYLEKIDKINPKQILNLMLSLQKIVDIIIQRMGEKSKWKWSFVDIQGRIAVIIKNFINFSDVEKARDPRKEFFQDRHDLLKMCKHSLNEAAKQYRTRYEISTQVPTDILKAIELLSALRKINILFGESTDASKLKNTIDALRARLEADEKQKDEKKKKK